MGGRPGQTSSDGHALRSRLGPGHVLPAPWSDRPDLRSRRGPPKDPAGNCRTIRLEARSAACQCCMVGISWHSEEPSFCSGSIGNGDEIRKRVIPPGCMAQKAGCTTGSKRASSSILAWMSATISLSTLDLSGFLTVPSGRDSLETSVSAVLRSRLFGA